MRTNVVLGSALMAMMLVLTASVGQADVFDMGPGLTSLEMVAVGSADNAPDTRYDPVGFGAVPYTYQIGKYEVTAGQYAAFLNALAATDTYGLYNTNMWSSDNGCKIDRSGSSGSYTYTVAADRANRPVNYVSWGDAARFANWLHNGQPPGAQDLTTTEDGSYYLNGATSYSALVAVTRKPGATWVIPTEDEWYKAAYHKNDGVTGNYWDYPTGMDAVPNNANPGGDTGNTANFYDGDFTVGYPYGTTPVGYFGLSDSPYGTFDQAGNLWEWNETLVYAPSVRILRGGSFYGGSDRLAASYRYSSTPPLEGFGIGFRMASVPEPGSIALLVVGGVSVLAYAWRRRNRAA